MRRRDEGADGKARVGAEGSEERTHVGGVREFKRGERGWMEAGVRGEQRSWVSSRWRCVSVLKVGRYWCVLIALVVSNRNLPANEAHLDSLAPSLGRNGSTHIKSNCLRKLISSNTHTF